MSTDRWPAGSQYAAEACDFLAESQSTGIREGISLAEVSKATGISRTYLYRFWDSAAAFTEDVQALQATSEDGWLPRCLANTAVPFADALEPALRLDDGHAPLRATIATRAPWSTSRTQLAAWEVAQVAALADRLREEHGSVAGAPWCEIAATAVALVEGMLLFPAHDGFPVEDPLALVATNVRLVIEHLVEHCRSAGPSLLGQRTAAPVEVEAGRQRVLERTMEAFADGRLQRDLSQRRLISMEGFARRLGVSTRRLFAVWPTAVDLNVAILVESYRQAVAASVAAVLEVFVDAVDHSNALAVFLRSNERMLDTSRFPESQRVLRVLELGTDPTLRSAWLPALRSDITDAQLSVAALLLAAGLQLLPGCSILDHTALGVTTHLGIWRVMTLHGGGVMHSPVTYLGIDTLSGAAGLDSFARVLTAPI